MPERDWERLAQSDSAELREEVTLKELKSESQKYIEAVRDLTDKELKVTAVDALIQADLYWESVRTAHEEADRADITWVRTRVRIVQNTLNAEWYRSNLSRSNKHQGKVFSKHIVKGPGKYRMSRFSGEPEWTRRVIAETEDRYQVDRERSAALTRIRRAIADYEKLIGRAYPDDQEEGVLA